jgi:REP element-mobilizing transposase RayT
MSSMNKKFYSSTRLKGYDYSSPGAYFITICTHQRSHIFGKIVGGEMELNIHGFVALDQFLHLHYYYEHIRVGTFVIMPNHVHAIIWIVEPGSYQNPGTSGKSRDRQPLTEIVRGYKTFSAKDINEFRQKKGVPVWQRGFYDHIIRNEHSLMRIRSYINNNPLTWEMDHENASKVVKDPFREWINNQAEQPILPDQFPRYDGI